MSGESTPRTGARPGCLVAWCVAALAFIGLAFILARSSAAKPLSGLAPEFTLSTYDGQSIALSSLRGQVVVINFWASWCDQCANEASVLEQAWRIYRDQDVVFIGVDCDDTAANGQNFIEHFGISYPNGLEQENKISDAYVVNGLPETFFIDQQGKIASTVMGPLTYEILVGNIEDLLDE